MPASRNGWFPTSGDMREQPRQLSFGFAAQRPVPSVRPSENLFFTLLPDGRTTRRIVDLADRVQRRLNPPAERVAAERFHVSLHNLGRYDIAPAELVARAKRIGAGLAAAPFQVAFNRVMHFRSGAVVLADGGEPSALTDFHLSLGAAIHGAGFGSRLRSAFQPHVTMMYSAVQVPAFEIEPITWTVRELVLVKSLVGQGRHIHLGRWPLRG